MKDYVAENERILNEWREKYVKENQKKYPKCPNLGDYFANDGIMFKGNFECEQMKGENEDIQFRRWKRTSNGEENMLWAKAPLRVLFITKDQNTQGDIAWDVRSETYRYISEKYKPDEMWLDTKSAFNRNLVYTLYGIFKTTADQPLGYNEFTNKEALAFVDNQIFARINCKKEVGEEKCGSAVLRKAINHDMELLKQQIVNLDADIFVCCGLMSFIPNLINSMGYNFKEQDDDKWIYYDLDNNKLIINSYHLSYSGFDYNGLITAYSKFQKKHPDFINSHRKE